MRILTFGSCLARYTAEHFIMLFGGRIVSSVFHNRSDAFVGKFMDRDWVSYDFDEMYQLLRTDWVDDNPDADPALILRNQYKESIGLHRLPGGIDLFSALRRKNFDLVIADNFMDLAGCLVSKKGESNAGIFLRPYDFASEDSTWARGEFLPPLDGVRNMKRILRYFQARVPAAKIVFMNFPYNMYRSSPERIKRTKIYEKSFSFDGAQIIPCLRVNPLFQTRNRQHFKPEQYCAYAGLIYQHLTQDECNAGDIGMSVGGR
ncbi:MAG: hypothetical protein AB9866_16700 [Syntrophobacteraceae bacterium]